MRISVYLPLLVAIVLAGTTPLLAGRLAPATGTRVLTAMAALMAACTTWGLTLLTLTLVTTTPMAIETGATGDPVPTGVAALATVLLLAAAVRTARVLHRRHRTQQGMRAVCRLCSPGGELAVVVDTTPQAFAVPGQILSTHGEARGGRILVSTGLLRTVTAADRQVVLAHERAHLHHHHHYYRGAVDVAAALNPLLVGSRTAIAYLVERWADETAASTTGSRTGVATALATVALATGPAPQPPPGALAFHRHAVLHRVRALHHPAPLSRPTLAYLLAVPVTLAAIASVDATLALTRLLHPLLHHLLG